MSRAMLAMLTYYVAMAGDGCHFVAEPEGVRVTPEPSDELLANPGMGWQTFHRFADEDPTLSGLPSTSAYFRFYWRELEPVEGGIDFSRLDNLLSRARRAGQKLAFRVMCAGTDDAFLYVPQWLKDKGCRGFEYQYQGTGPRHWVPDMDDPLFLDAHLTLIEELGSRYDGHPDLDLVDIGSVGLWGEWHMSGTGVEMPSEETRLTIIDAYLKAFPHTPKVMLIGETEGMKHAISNGAGWRADCLGDMGGFSKDWNHMEHFYLQQIRRTNASEAWKQAPVAFESCWDMRKWVREGWNVPSIFDYALDLHASYVNNKSAPIPEPTREEVERLLRKLGYRLILRDLEHLAKGAPGSSFWARMVWENVGVAPPYRDYRLALRLTHAQTGEAHILASNESIQGWLPGEREVVIHPVLPDSLAPGVYRLSIAAVEPATEVPEVQIAIKGRGADGWYSLSRVEIVAP